MGAITQRSTRIEPNTDTAEVFWDGNVTFRESLLILYLRGYQSADSSRWNRKFLPRQEAQHSRTTQAEARLSQHEPAQGPSRDTYSGFHFWPVCWGTSWSLVHMALEVANQKPDGSRICFPTRLGRNKQPQHKKPARETRRQTAQKPAPVSRLDRTEKRTVWPGCPAPSLILPCKAR